MSERCAAGYKTSYAADDTGIIALIHIHDRSLCNHLPVPSDSSSRDSHPVGGEEEDVIPAPTVEEVEALKLLGEAQRAARNSPSDNDLVDRICEAFGTELCRVSSNSPQGRAVNALLNRLRSLRSSLATVSKERDEALKANEAMAEALRGIRILADADLEDVAAIVEAIDDAPCPSFDRAPRPEETGESVVTDKAHDE